jgi:transposase, IS30 family
MSGSALTLEERYLIHAGTVAKLRVVDIARQLRRNRSSIYDELQRGADSAGEYCAHRGQQAREAASMRSATNVVGKSCAQWQSVKASLEKGWTPEQICGRRAWLKSAAPISFQAIYATIRRNGWEHLLASVRARRNLKRPARRPWNGSARPIQERDPDVSMRHQLGNWEADTMTGKQKDRKRLLVMCERQSLYMNMALLNGTEAKPTARLMKRRLETNGIAFLSVTTDRGSEFSATGEAMGHKAFACDAYSPNQRGTNENQIGMLRRDLPKGMTMDNLTRADVRKLEQKYNNTPRKCLGFRTPSEVAFGHLPRVGTRT